jgi:hypothetical protein
MKSEKKLQEAVNLLKAIDSPRADEAARLIIDFMIDNVKQNKGELLCRDFVSKDNYRSVMHFIFHDAEHKTAVATDKHALFANEAEYIETCGNGLRDILGNEVGDIGVFPKWFSVLPKQTEDTTIDENLEQTYKKALSEAKIQGGQSNKSKIFILVNGQQWMSARNVEFMLRAGLDGWKVSLTNTEPQFNPLYKEWYGKRLLLMPSYKDATPNETRRKYKYFEK